MNNLLSREPQTRHNGTHDAPRNPFITVRPATTQDFPAIARLLRQLYAAEFPGALSGESPIERLGQEWLLQFTLEAKRAQGLHGRYVACNAAGHILATATMERPGSPRFERAPNGTLPMALTLLGYKATARLLLTVAHSMAPVPRPATTDAVWLHSVVVDEHYRGQGIGRALMAALERRASDAGYQSLWLQVLARNHAAHHFYRRLGYTEVGRTPFWQRSLTWPSHLMRKVIPSDQSVDHLPFRQPQEEYKL